MESDPTLPREAAMEPVLDEDGGDVTSSQLIDHYPDASDTGMIESPVSIDPLTQDTDRDSQPLQTSSNLFLRQTSVLEEAETSAFSFSKIPPRLVSISRAVVKPGLLFTQIQQEPRSDDIEEQAIGSDLADPPNHIDLTGGDDSDALSMAGFFTQPVSSVDEEQHESVPDDNNSTTSLPQSDAIQSASKRPLGFEVHQTHDSKRQRLQAHHQHVSSSRSRSRDDPGITPEAASRPSLPPVHAWQTINTVNSPASGRDGTPTSRSDRANGQHNTTSAVAATPLRTSTVTHVRPAPAADTQEMNEALQIVAHTWAKAQSIAVQRAQSLAQDLTAAKAQIVNLSRNLHVITAENDQYVLERTDHIAREDDWRLKFDRLRDIIHDLHGEMITLRTNADVQRDILKAEKAKIRSLDVVVAKLESQVLRRAKRTQKLSKSMLETMNRMNRQLQTSQVTGDYLFMQLEEKTGLLVEARDEFKILRSRQSSDALHTALLNEKIEAGKTAIIEHINSLDQSTDRDDRLADTVREVTTAVESAHSRRECDYALLQTALADLVTRFTDWAAQSAKADVESQTIDTTLLEQQFSQLTDAINLRLDGLKDETVMRQKLSDLERKVAQSDSKIAELTRAAAIAESIHNKTREKNEWMNAELSQLTTANDAREGIIMVRQELESLKKEARVMEARLEDCHKDRNSLREQLAVVIDQLNAALSEASKLRDEQKVLHDAMAKAEFAHSEIVRQLKTEHEHVRSEEKEASTVEIRQREESLELALTQIAETKEQLQLATTERDELRTDMVRMADEHEQHLQSAPLLEEELAILRDQLDTAVALHEESKAALAAEEVKHTRELSKLVHDVEVSQEQCADVSKEAAQSKTAKEELEERFSRLQLVVDQQQHDLFETTNNVARVTSEAQQFKDGVDKMWKKEEEKHNSELAMLQTGHAAVQTEMLQAQNHVVSLTGKLSVAQKTIQELQAHLEQTKSTTAQYTMLRQSISRSEGRPTPESAMNELFNLLSQAEVQERAPPLQETAHVPDISGTWLADVVSDVQSNHSRSSAQANTSSKVSRTDAGNMSNVVEQAGSLAHQPRRQDSQQLTKTPAQPEKFLGSARKLATVGTQHVSERKRHQDGSGTDRANFSDMLLSSASSRQEHNLEQTSTTQTVPQPAPPATGRRKIKALANSQRRPLEAVDGNQRSRARLTRQSKQRYDDRFNQEL